MVDHVVKFRVVTEVAVKLALSDNPHQAAKQAVEYVAHIRGELAENPTLPQYRDVDVTVTGVEQTS